MSAGAVALLYDRECRFCETVADAMLSWDRRGRLRPVPVQSDEGQALLGEIPVAERLASFHLAAPGQPVVSGGPALAELVALMPAGALPARALRILPRPTAASYGWVARHRIAISRYVPTPLKDRARRRLAERLTSDSPRT